MAIIFHYLIKYQWFVPASFVVGTISSTKTVLFHFLDYFELNDLKNAVDQCKKILRVEKSNEWAVIQLIKYFKGLN